ncbi:MAG: hypothetical protein ACO31W_09615, partial [Gemmatimonadaceae bacterium]
QNDPSAYGYLCQYSIPNDLAEESCVPTSTVNALAYLQNRYASQLGGVQLVGSGYAGWNATAQTLQGFMGTTADSATTLPGAAVGLQNYLISIGAAGLGTLQGISAPVSPEYPSWMSQGAVLGMSNLYGWISSGAGVTLGISYFNGGGHQITMTGLNWNDANGNGIVELSEGATISAIDPLDPSAAYSGSDVLGLAKTATLSVWQDAAHGGLLSYSYQQYTGGLPFEPSNYTTASGLIFYGTSISVIPGPASWIVVLVAGACGSRRRR